MKKSIAVIDRIKAQLGERISEVKTTDRLVSSPARLVDPEGTLNPELQRVYRMLDKKFEVPQKVLEINPRHPIIQRLASLPADSPVNELVIEQVYEDALLIEGLHPDPASMIDRIQKLMEKALGLIESPSPDALGWLGWLSLLCRDNRPNHPYLYIFSHEGDKKYLIFSTFVCEKLNKIRHVHSDLYEWSIFISFELTVIQWLTRLNDFKLYRISD